VAEEVILVDASAAPPATLESFYDEILALSFRPAELISRAGFLRSFVDKASVSQGTLAVDAAGLVVGGIIGEWFAECRVILGSYAAVRRGYRGQGLGTRLISDILRIWAARFQPALILGEVEDPRYYRADDSSFGDPDARLRLYEALGARILPLPYFQPALSTSQPRVPHLLLMVFAADPSAITNHNNVDADVVRCFIENNIARSEGPVDDDEVRDLRRALHGKSSVPLIPPAEFLRRKA
jgi:GNAT superfamily N-acetyltransferase